MAGTADPRPPRAAVMALDDLPPGGSARVRALGTTVALHNVDGRIYAVNDRCPHHGGPLCRGRVSGARVASEPYHYAYEADRHVLTCPWHHWQFDLSDGAALFDPRVRLRTYRVEIQDGEIVLSS